MHKPQTADLIQLVRGLLVIMDPGRDQDDEDVLVMLNRAIRCGILDVLGVVANLKPSKKRARLAKGTLDILGQSDIPVGFGSGHEAEDDDGLRYEFEVGYMAPHDNIVDGRSLISEAIRSAPGKGIILTLISQLTDAAQALREYPDWFVAKVRRVVIMGGVTCKGDFPLLDDNGYLLPDLSAQNHAFDKESASFLYHELQHRGIPMTILSRHAAAAAKVPRRVYDDMAATGHPVGVRLQRAQRQAIEELWRRANFPASDAARHGLPARCDKAWFCSTFCGGQGSALTAADSVWELVQSFMLYDPCTLLAALPGLREYFYSPYVHEIRGAEHMVIGLSTERHGVSRPEELASYLQTALIESLEMSLETAHRQVG